MVRNLINQDIAQRLAVACGHDGIQAGLTAHAEAVGRGRLGYSSDSDN
jgi:hypothetical protein